MGKIVVVGSMNMDYVIQLDRFPAPGETVAGHSLELFLGGKGANQCVSVARLGGDAEMVGMLGRDANGETFRSLLRTEGIRHAHVYDCDAPTGMAQIQVNARGQNCICLVAGANHRFGEAELERARETVTAASMVIVQLELRLEAVEQVVALAHGAGVPVLLNPAPAVPLSPEMLAHVDYITPNETELAVLTGMPTDTPEEQRLAAERLLEMGVGCVVATLGSHGAMIVTRKGVQTVAGFPVEAVDTVAAGDSFNGALAVALTEGKSLSEAVRFANAMGALTVTEKGAIPSLHRRAEVEAFLTAHT